MSGPERPSADAESDAVARIDTTVAHPARRYNYWLGGKDHFAADRESGDAVIKVFPTARAAALANRAFMGRAVAYLAREVGVRQFLDIGTGIPAPDNTHEVAQAIAPESRVVYVDNDPIVMAHVRALLTSTPQGATAYIEADVRRYQTIVSHPALTGTLDLSRPVGLLLVALLHFMTDDEDPAGIVRGLVSALAPGSYVVMSHGTADFAAPDVDAAGLRAALRHGSIYPRTLAQFQRMVGDLELVEPGIVSVDDWRPADGRRLSAADAATYVAVARVP